jgi:hypothetical protein
VLTVAVALIVLLGCAALSVDIGMLAVAASRAQSTADMAALAAASDTINGQSIEMRRRVSEIIAANNQAYLVQLVCDVDDILVYGSGSSIPGYGDLNTGQEAVQVTVRLPVEMCFSRALGINVRDVVRSAVALRTPPAGGDAVIFAGSSRSGENGYHMSGQRARIGGAVHSNTAIQISGGYGIYSGLVEYRGKFADSGQNNVYQQGVRVGRIEPLPITYTPEDFGPYDYEIRSFGSSQAYYVVPPGVYRVHGEVRISGEHTIMDNVTWVADGQIIISGKACHYTANRLGMFAYSLDTGSNAIQVSGGSNGCIGTLFAPNGTAHFSGGSMTTTYGAIVAQTVEISGADFCLMSPTGASGGGALVKLVK